MNFGDKFVDAAIEILFGVRSGDHDSNARLSHRDSGKTDGHGEDIVFEQPPAEFLRNFHIAQHYGCDRRFTPAGIETGFPYSLFEIASVAPQLLYKVTGGFQDIDGGAAGRNVGRRERARKQERSPLLP